ncbi:MAG: trehalose-phosphatase [Gammaproteobacteria bacterium]|nr:trehalose-phosphatase [Gammaproteobacteria bacterium]
MIEFVQGAKRVRFFLDYDGTLAEFAATPDEIYPDPELIDLLERLKTHPKYQVAIISGRRLSHIRKLVPISGMILAGTYGIEMVDPHGKKIERVDYQKIRPGLEGLKSHWADLIEPHPKFYLEDKGWSLALHAKFVEEKIAKTILKQAKRVVFELNISLDEFRVLGGDKFLEVAPKIANKGLTIDFLLSEYPFEDSLLLYVGDDDKDEEAFEVILKREGIAIKVCPKPCRTAAQLILKSPADVRKFLHQLL